MTRIDLSPEGINRITGPQFLAAVVIFGVGIVAFFKITMAVLRA